MHATFACRRITYAALMLAGVGIAVSSIAAPLEPVMSLAAKEKAPLLDTLKDLVSIESGSGDREGLDKISELIAGKLRALGGAVEFVEPNPADIYPMVDTPAARRKTAATRCTSLRIR